MHSPISHHSRFPETLRVLALAGAVGLMPAAAMAGSTGMNQASGSSPAANQSASQAQGMDQPGDQITLSQDEAAEWQLRPVVNQDGEQVGRVSAITLNQQGNIEELEVDMAQTMGLGGETVTVGSDQFSANKERIRLDMPNADIKDLPRVQ